MPCYLRTIYEKLFDRINGKNPQNTNEKLKSYILTEGMPECDLQNWYSGIGVNLR